jgi:preprotein translocase subunit SecD
MTRRIPTRQGAVAALLALGLAGSSVPAAYALPNAGLTIEAVDDKPHQSERKEQAAFFEGRTIWLKSDHIVWGNMVASAVPAFDRNGSPIIAFTLTDKGKAAFAELTRANVGNRIAVMVDGVVITAPMLLTPIEGGQGQITGHFTLEEAKALALAITNGAKR